MSQQDDHLGRHLRKLHEDLDRAEADLARMREQLASAASDENPSLNEQLDTLERDLTKLREDLESGRSAEPHAWDEVKTGLDLTWREIKTGLEMLMGRRRGTGADGE